MTIRTPTVLGLLARHARAVVGPTIVLAVLAFAAAGIAAAAPRLVGVVGAAELRSDIAAVAPAHRDITTSTPLYYLGPDGTADAFQTLAGTAPPGLQSRLAVADWFARTADSAAQSDDASKNGWVYRLSYQIDPQADERIAYTAGRAPRPSDQVIEIAMSTSSAEEMRWDLGETRTVDPDGVPLPPDGDTASGVFRATLVGTFDVVDPAADFWGHATGVAQPDVFDDGDHPRRIRAVAVVDPSAAQQVAVTFAVTGWYSLDLADITPESAGTLLPEIRKFVAAHPVFGGTSGFSQQVSLDTGLTTALPDAAARTDALRAILLVVAAGPFGAMIAVFELAVRTIVARRRPTIALASARGASGAQLRGALALEGVAGGLIPGLLGILAAVLLVPGLLAPLDLVPALLLALVPIGFLALQGGERGLRDTRSDGGGGRAAAVRIVVEIAIWLLAAGSVALLLTRGLGSVDEGVAFDPFVVAAPILLALAVCVLVLRLLPPVLAAIHRGMRSRSGLIGFAGSARAVRERGLGVGAALAVVIAVGIAIFAVTLGATVSGATRDTARLAAGGGDALLSNSSFSTGQIDATTAVEGVERLAPIEDLGQTKLDGWLGGRIDLVATQWTDLAAIRDDIPADLADAPAGTIPAIVSATTAASLQASGATLSYRDQAITIVGTLPADPGWRLASQDWVLVDTSHVIYPSGQSFTPDVLIVQQQPGTVLSLDALTTASGAAYTVSLDEALGGLSRSPAVAALGGLLGVAAVLAALLALVAIMLAGQLVAAASRRIYGALRTLGATRSQIAGLSVWTVAPSIAAALVAGVGLGVALPYLVIAGVDLGPFTGGAVVTTPSANPWAIGAIAVALLIDAAAISIVAAAFTVRRSPAATVSIGGD